MTVAARTRRGLALASVTMVLWGIVPLALKITLGSMDAYTITWYRFVASALVLGAVLASRRRLPALATLDRRGWWLLGLATALLAANYVCYLLGLEHTTPANSQVLIQIAPVLLALGGLWVFDERFTRLQWLGFAVLLVGLATFVGDQLRGQSASVSSREYWIGCLMMLLAAVAWAVYGLAQKQLLRWLPPQGSMLCIYAGCAALLGPLCAPARVAHMDGLGLAMLGFCAVNTLVAYGTFSEALACCEASRVGAVLALTPVATIATGSAAHALWPDVLAATTASRVGLLGAGFVVLGSLLSAFGAGTGASRSSGRVARSLSAPDPG